MCLRYFRFVILLLAFAPIFAAAINSGRYAVILLDEPVAEHFPSRRDAGTEAVRQYRQQIATAQAALKRELQTRNITVTGATQELLNAVYIQATPEQAGQVRSLTGVKDVVPLKRFRRQLNKAVGLTNIPAAWNSLGGVSNAGLGMKIAIIDTGIDQTHPGFQDASLTVPAGFPKCDADCAFTNNKVIAARSYVKQLAAGSQPNPAADSTPDDYSARDRVGHGTAVAMVAAGETNTGPSATITGVAPKAYLGNYKVFGSPGVIDFTTGDVIIAALEQALNDGMDVAVLSLGGPAFSGPLDKGVGCGGSNAQSPCDPEALAVENAVQSGLVVAVAGGNEGQDGTYHQPTANTIDSPGDAPDAIAAGASTNSHIFVSSLRLNASNAPTNLQQVEAEFGDGPLPSSPLTAPLRDVTQVGGDPLGCAAYQPTALQGTIALIERGTCTFLQKVNNAQNAGALGVVIYIADQSALFAPGGLTTTTIPAVIVGNADGLALKSFIDSNGEQPVTLDPTIAEFPLTTFNTVANFSSVGPATGTSAIKPDIAAVGTNMYMAAERYDPNGELYSSTGYTVANGTSFSTPMVGGAAALVKQKNPSLSPVQIKSVLVNSATQDVTVGSSPARVSFVGGGKLNGGGALISNVTVVPPTLSFGVLNNKTLPQSQGLQITNIGSNSVNLSLSVAPRDQDSNAHISLDKQSLSLSPGQSGTVNAMLSGTTPKPGSYEGQMTVQGASTAVQVSYLYLVGDGVPYDIIPLSAIGFDGTVNQDISDGIVSFKVIDQYGVPVANQPVQFAVKAGGGQILNADTKTDQYGIAAAEAIAGPNPGGQSYTGSAGSLQTEFDGTARLNPTIAAIVNSASFAGGQPVAPGSVVSIFGTGLSDTTDQATYFPLPLNIDLATVSFDVPSAGISLPGHLYYAAPGLINVQVPWELQGQTSVMVKVRVEDSIGPIFNLPLATYSPAVYKYNDSSGQGQAIATDLQGHLIGASNAAVRGQFIQIYATGLGPVTNQPASGNAAQAQPLSMTQSTPTVMIGGQMASSVQSALAPTYAGLYVINAVVPTNISTGSQMLTVSVGGQSSPAVNLNVQ